ncbi:MAG: tRNA pseudouridine(38-40) synthase TruA [Bdellovibrionales bacterium]|nr:tRNA pseudouridine(38-40) synthase TruA [Bdellovibrionales bacterium]
MTRIRLDLRYDGTGYLGWQKQPKAPMTIQNALEEALFSLIGIKPSTVGSGRTDAGAHARQQVVHFDFDGPTNKYPWVNAINSKLPQQIQLFEAYEAPLEFHSLLSAEKKEYVYFIHNAELPPVFRRDFCWWQRRPLDVAWLNTASKFFVGEHDFKSFQNTGTLVPSTIRTVFLANWTQISPQTLKFRIIGNGFLKQMVRNIVGTLVELSFQKREPIEILKVLQAQDRGAAGQTAPAQGLFLNRVSYPQKLDNKCRKL